MSPDYLPNRKSSETLPDLLNKPQRRSRLPLLLLLFGCLIALGGGGVLTWQLLFHQPAPGNAQGGASPATTKQAQSLKDCSHGYPPGYNDTIRQQVAQGLHLTVAQTTTKLQSGQQTGKQIIDVATEQGISSHQLFTVELHAYQVADNSMVSYGCLNQYAANHDVQTYQNDGADSLNYRVTFLFTHV